MKTISFIASAILFFGIFNSSSAQIPKFKLPKLTDSKPQSQTETTQSPSSSQTAPATKTSAATQASVNLPSIQINLRTHQQYYRGATVDQDTWSWTPRIKYRVNGPIPAGSQLSVEFILPSGKAWIKYDCPTSQTQAGYWWETECGINTSEYRDQDATIETGLASFKINLKNELQGTSSTLFAGKFKVDKAHVGVIDLPKFKNNFAYYVNYDWNLPIGYLYSYDALDARPGYPPSPTEGRLGFITWFRGSPKLMEYGKYVAYLYYQGEIVADTSGENGKRGDTYCEEVNAADRGNDPDPLTYCRRRFIFPAMVWDKQPDVHANDFAMYLKPGEYEIKVLQNGKLARVAKFTMGKEYAVMDTGIGPRNNLGTGRIVVPVQVLGDTDGAWDRNAWKVEAFYGNLLTGFTAP